MKIHWIPKPDESGKVEELLKIEYDFRKALTKSLLHIIAEDRGDDDTLSNYEFTFNTLTGKFSTYQADCPICPVLQRLLLETEVKSFFEV